MQKSLTYSDIADLATSSPMIITGRVKGVQKVKIDLSGSGQNEQRYLLVRVEVEALIRGQNGVSPEISFLAKQTDTDDFLKRKARIVLFALPTNKPMQVQLAGRNAVQPWSPELEALARKVTGEFLKSDSPPAITGVGDAFHVAGTIAGEGETQIFLKTETRDPISLSIIHRPGQPVRWGVSLGEIVDESAVPPERETLLWYRLACSLPSRLPAESTRTLPVQDAEAARKDYAFVLESLGSCGRTM